MHYLLNHGSDTASHAGQALKPLQKVNSLAPDAVGVYNSLAYTARSVLSASPAPSPAPVSKDAAGGPGGIAHLSSGTVPTCTPRQQLWDSHRHPEAMCGHP